MYSDPPLRETWWDPWLGGTENGHRNGARKAKETGSVTQRPMTTEHALIAGYRYPVMV